MKKIFFGVFFLLGIFAYFAVPRTVSAAVCPPLPSCECTCQQGCNAANTGCQANPCNNNSFCNVGENAQNCPTDCGGGNSGGGGTTPCKTCVGSCNCNNTGGSGCNPDYNQCNNDNSCGGCTTGGGGSINPCNNNGTCNTSNGETTGNCPSDCPAPSSCTPGIVDYCENTQKCDINGQEVCCYNITTYSDCSTDDPGVPDTSFGGGDGCAYFPNNTCQDAGSCHPTVVFDTGLTCSNGLSLCQDDCRGYDCKASCTGAPPPAGGSGGSGSGGACQGSDYGTPPAPTLNPPDGGSTSYAEGGQATVSWNTVALADTYEIEIYPAGTSCSDANSYCGVAGTSWSFTPVTSSYFYQVRGVNICGNTSGPWALATITITGQVSGQIKLDNDSLATLVGGVCQLGGASGVQPGAGSQVVVDGTYAGSVDGSGNYTVSSAPAGPGHTAVLSLGDPGTYRCTCPSGCSYSVSAPKSGLDYFVSSFKTAWFQVTGGNLHANQGSVASEIPGTCSGACSPYLIKADVSGATGLVSFSDTLDLGEVAETNISETSDDWKATTTFEGLVTGYDYFRRILEDDPVDFSAWDGIEPTINGVYETASEDRISGSDWNVASGTLLVILVDGDLTIDANIDVAEGGFLGFVVSGNILIGDNVTNVEGVYIADGAIATCESLVCGTGGLAEQLTGEGIFVGWQGLDLRRNFLDSSNDSNPAETFIYRPDLQVNAYNYLLRPKFTWAEIAP